MAEHLLRVRDLVVRYPAGSRVAARLRGARPATLEAVAGVSLEVGAGETLGVAGESGSGKSTLGRALIGLVPAAAGSIEFLGRRPDSTSDGTMRPYRRQMGMVFQDPVGSLSPRLTVGTLLAEPFRIHGLEVADLDAEVRKLLALVGLGPFFAGRYPHQLSGGQARRVGVARALATGPKLVIADEPTAGLDVSIQGGVLNLLGRLQRERALALIVITHNLPVVRHVSDRLAIMYMGRFVEEGATATVFKRPAHPYTAALLAAVPPPEPGAPRLAPPLLLKGEVPSLLARPPGCEFHTRCPFAQDRCRRERPEPQARPAGQMVRCHFPLA